jgi:hypothetical protein
MKTALNFCYRYLFGRQFAMLTVLLTDALLHSSYLYASVTHGIA